LYIDPSCGIDLTVKWLNKAYTLRSLKLFPRTVTDLKIFLFVIERNENVDPY